MSKADRSGSELAPLGRRRLDFSRLHPDEFELLCCYIAGIEFPGVIHVADPDGGVDTALPQPDRTWERCWQAKRFTESIKWPQCKDSLDAAVENYGMPHYTFCFARDLTVGQEKLFKQHLVGRHHGVAVDYWNASELELRLFSTEQGKRIAAEFWGDREADTRAIARAIRAQGELSSGAQVVDRLAAIAEHLREGDPFYTYITVTAEVDAPRPAPTPRTVLAVETVEAGSSIRIEAVPRPTTQPEQLPGGTVHMTAAQARQFERFLSRGGELALEGVQLDMHNLPSAFEGLNPGGEDMTLMLRAPRTLPPPWHARFSLEIPGFELEPISFYLEPTLEVPEDWDAALTGQNGTVTTTLFLRKREGRGELRVHWSFTDDVQVPTDVRAQQLDFVAGLNSGGRLVIEDHSGVRPRLELDTVKRDLGGAFDGLRTFTSDLALIEKWTGNRYTLPDHIPLKEARAVHEMAQIIRAGDSKMDFSNVSLTMPKEKAKELLRGKQQFLLEVGIGLAVLGVEIPIGRLRGVVSDVKISYADSQTPGAVEVTIEPASEEAAHPTFELVR